VLAAGLTSSLVIGWRGVDPRRDDFSAKFGLAVCATLLVSPHTQWYESGLLLLPVLLTLDQRLRCGAAPRVMMRLLLAAGLFLPMIYDAGRVLGWQPVILLPLGVSAWLAWAPVRLRRADVERIAQPVAHEVQ
jgi:hypothetical protein